MDFLFFLQNIRNGFLDTLFSGVTFLGTNIALIALFSVNYWYVDKKFACEIGESFFISGILVQSIKITFRVPRPFVRDTRLIPVTGAVGGATGYSFPSAHTQTAVSALIPAAYEYRKKKFFSVLCCLLVLLVMLSRMYLGVHTPADVFTAFFISLICVMATVYIRRKTGRDILLYFIAAMSLVSAVYAAALFGKGIIASEYLADSIKTAGAGLAFSIGIFLERKFCNFNTENISLKKGILRILFGLLGAAFLYSSKLLYEDSLILDGSRYFAVVFWIVFIYPMIFTKYDEKNFLKAEENQYEN